MVQKKTDAVNKGQLDTAVSDSESTTIASIETKIEELEEASIRAAQSENVFLRVMDSDLFKEDDDDISKVGSMDKDYHTINHKTYLFYIDYDSSIGHYSTRLSIDLVYLPIGYYTMAPIDLNKNGISGLKEGTKSGNAVTVKQLNDTINSYISILITNTVILKVTFLHLDPNMVITLKPVVLKNFLLVIYYFLNQKKNISIVMRIR